MIDKFITKINEVEERYSKSLSLIANENIVSQKVHQITTSPLSYRYNFASNDDNGVIVSGGFCMKAMDEFDEFINMGKSVLKNRLNAKHIIMNTLSGSHAMLSILLTSTNPGDTIMTVPSNQGGHFLTNNILEKSGRKHVDTSYDFSSFNFDSDGISKSVEEHNVKCIYFDTSTQLNPIPISEIRSKIPSSTLIICDLSHTLGLTLGGNFGSPLDEGADIITGNTHKTFPGTHKGIIAFKNELFGKNIEKDILLTTMSSNHTGMTLGLCGALIEIDPFIEDYSKKIINYANTLGGAFKKHGFNIRRVGDKYTNNHQIHVFIPEDIEHTLAIKILIESNIFTSTSRSLSVDRGNFFLRIGVQELVYRGFSEEDLLKIPKIISNVFSGKNQKEIIEEIVGKYGTFFNI